LAWASRPIDDAAILLRKTLADFAYSQIPATHDVVQTLTKSLLAIDTACLAASHFSYFDFTS